MSYSIEEVRERPDDEDTGRQLHPTTLRSGNCCWIRGTHVRRLSVGQLENLGGLLANIHSVRSSAHLELNFWHEFLETNKSFGDEQSFLDHPDETLKKLLHKGNEYFRSRKLHTIRPSLIHGDVSLGNMLATGDTISLIDWEFARFTDPMADFAAMFYEDMAYNKGRWRIHITQEEKATLLSGYTRAGGRHRRTAIKSLAQY